MRHLRLATAAAAFVSTLCVLSTASADEMDPALERLTIRSPFDPQNPKASCTDKGKFIGNIDPSTVVFCKPDNLAFAKLINQYAGVIAPTAMHAARTTGYGGFHLSFEMALTSIDKDSDYMRKGTRGASNSADGTDSIVNTNPAGNLPVYSIRVRKGFPFGFEVAAQVGYVGSTSIVTGGADVRLALLEGFRKGFGGVLPDVALGAGVRTITGTPQFNLTVASFDLKASKPLPVGDSSVITPYIGFQNLWIWGDSGLIDTTPNTDALGYCRYGGANVPGNPDLNKKDPSGKPVYDGQPVCRAGGHGGSSLDFNNSLVFDNVRLQRQRLILGASYRYEMVSFGLQWMTDIKAPEDGAKFLGIGNRVDSDKLKGVPKQSTFVFELGALF